jgi:tetratricopeptide (TPR) repeat protein
MHRARAEGDELLRLLAERPLTEQTFALTQELLESDEHSWAQQVSMGSIRNAAVIEHLTQHAHDLLGDRPRWSVVLMQLALRFVETLRQPEISLNRSMKLEADANKEYASALLECSEIREALKAVERADTFYDLLPFELSHRPQALLQLIKGRLLHKSGRSGEGLIMIEQATNFLKGFCRDDEKYITGKTIYGYILYEIGRYRDALFAFEMAAEAAEHRQDGIALAYILDNVGLCAVKLTPPDYEKAEQCFTFALQRFEEAGLAAEVMRVRQGRIMAMVASGQYNEALMQCYANRSEALKLGLPIFAAFVSVRIAEIQIQSGRAASVRALLRESLETLSKAGLHLEARRALSYLYEIGSERPVTLGDVHYVRQFVDRLSNDDALVFTRPA